MTKQIIIIGGGISGLAVLHNLKKQKFQNRDDIQILLIEKNSPVGGSIQSESRGGCLFESGPEGFLNSNDSTRQLIREIGLEADLIAAQPAAKLRYLRIHNQLHALPMSPAEFFRFKPLGILDKLRALGEFFVPAKCDPSETIYQFGRRRFGEKFTRYFFAAMAKGVYGGDIEELNLKTAFPGLYALEEKHGSVIKGGWRQFKERKSQRKREEAESKRFLPGQLCSLSRGMAQLTQTLYQKYRDNIHTGEKVLALTKFAQGYVVETNKLKYFADKVFLCVPAGGAAGLLKPFNESLAARLVCIDYASLVVVGLVYRRSAFAKIPEGFGYLIPGDEGKGVLGVIFSSNIFTGRSDADHFLFRIMLAGDKQSDADYLALAQQEISQMLNPASAPTQSFIARWPKAIPQYTTRYQEMMSSMEEETARLENIKIVANYLGGVGVNDCTQNAKNAVANFVI